MTRDELWAWLNTCPTHKWECIDLEDDYMRVIFPTNDPEEDES
jgi:hypothetical protein